MKAHSLLFAAKSQDRRALNFASMRLDAAIHANKSHNSLLPSEKRALEAAKRRQTET